jgi:hypothetical protein
MNQADKLTHVQEVGPGLLRSIMISHSAVEKHSDRSSADNRTDAFPISGGITVKLTNLKLHGPSLARVSSKVLGWP